MRDPKYVTTDQNRIRPRVNDMENGVFNIFVTMTTEMKVHVVTLQVCFKVCFQVCFQVCLLVIEGLYSSVQV